MLCVETRSLFSNWDKRKKKKEKKNLYLSLKKRSVLALQAKLQVLFPYASCILNSSSGSFQPFVEEQRETINISCVAFAYLQVPWKLLKCKRNNVIIYLSSSTCSLQRKEEKNTCTPIHSQSKRCALFIERQIEGSSGERWAKEASVPNHLLHVQESFYNCHSLLKGR